MNNYFFSQIKYFKTIDSTNSELLNKNYKDKTLIYTFNQTKGRGRFDRNWITFENKSLALSFLIKNFPLNYVFIINMILSITLNELLREKFKLKSWIKWPNDIYIEDKKLAGILTETKFVNNDNFKIVSGIGININVNKNEISIINKKATSILLEYGSEIDIREFTFSFIDSLSKNFSNFYLNFEKNNLEKTAIDIKKKWLNYSNILGKKVKISNIYIDNNKNMIEGIVEDIDNEGFLIIRKNNEMVKILNGDVVFLN